MIKDPAVGGLFKAAGAGRLGDLGILDPLFVENREDSSPGAHLVMSRSEAKNWNLRLWRQEEAWRAPARRAQLGACPKASTGSCSAQRLGPEAGLALWASCLSKQTP